MTIALFLAALVLFCIGIYVTAAAAGVTFWCLAVNTFEWPVLLLWTVAGLFYWAAFMVLPITVSITAAS